MSATDTAAATVPAPAQAPGQAGGTGESGPGAEVVCLGESMVTFVPQTTGRLADVPAFTRAIGGAESNVACALAAAGHRARWVSRVGADGFGEHLVDAIAAYGVDTSAVTRDPARPTGIYFRTAADRDADAAFEVVYYRAGSAASAMSPHTVPLDALRDTRVLHVTGITAALSPDCLALLRTLTERAPGRPLVSFDVNFRASLWPDRAAAGEVLLGLARGADLVFVGEDEAETAWGVTGGPQAVRDALPEPTTLVVKQGAGGATVFTRSGAGEDATPANGAGDPRTGEAPAALRTAPDAVIHEPAPRVDVVAPVGAGDAFAAGYLSGLLRGLPVADRLRQGHLLAANVLTVAADLTTPPPCALTDRLAALDAEEWGGLALGPGWAEAAQSAEAAGAGGAAQSAEAAEAGGAARSAEAAGA
ncbi:putative 2-oxo-3-deoxygluconate kinase [Streptomyces sp. Tu6071]|uniref:sugar kinase n=1 Tax=Streptomyces sp. Tu6071 TaxID=355249 RepID=UPI00020E5695|nr:sugar kinase [Streptomyces sp. Tu6071]EGJ75021.1 putative 2-oxo-3-deoxygluconate kinase [Streptomyces sp. Tu6071]